MIRIQLSRRVPLLFTVCLVLALPLTRADSTANQDKFKSLGATLTDYLRHFSSRIELRGINLGPSHFAYSQAFFSFQVSQIGDDGSTLTCAAQVTAHRSEKEPPPDNRDWSINYEYHVSVEIPFDRLADEVTMESDYYNAHEGYRIQLTVSDGAPAINLKGSEDEERKTKFPDSMAEPTEEKKHNDIDQGVAFITFRVKGSHAEAVKIQALLHEMIGLANR